MRMRALPFWLSRFFYVGVVTPRKKNQCSSLTVRIQLNTSEPATTKHIGTRYIFEQRIAFITAFEQLRQYTRRSQTMTTRSKAAKSRQTKARNDRNYQERSLAAEMGVKPGALREMMEDVMMDDEHSDQFNQQAWEKLKARLPVS